MDAALRKPCGLHRWDLMIEQKTTAIGNSEYRVSQLPAGKSRRLLTHLFRTCGPALGKLVGESGAGKSLVDVEMTAVGSAIAELSERLSEQDVERVFDAVFGSGTVEVMNSEGAWRLLTNESADGYFAGRVHEQFLVAWFALKVNYSGFLDAFKGLSAGS